MNAGVPPKARLKAMLKRPNSPVREKDREKDRLSLRNAKARLNVLESQLGTLRGEHAGTAAEYSSVEKERDELFNSFEASVKQVQQKTDFRNIVLDQKLGNMESSLENAKVQVTQIVGAANLDPIEMEKVEASLDDTLSTRCLLYTSPSPRD